jgi:hypothetical protein
LLCLGVFVVVRRAGLQAGAARFFFLFFFSLSQVALLGLGRAVGSRFSVPVSRSVRFVACVANVGERGIGIFGLLDFWAGLAGLALFIHWWWCWPYILVGVVKLCFSGEHCESVVVQSSPEKHVKGSKGRTFRNREGNLLERVGRIEGLEGLRGRGSIK